MDSDVCFVIRMQALGLPILDQVGTIDPFVKIENNSHDLVATTKHQRNNRNPNWPPVQVPVDRLTYAMPFENCKNLKVMFNVFNYNIMRSNEYVGGVCLEVADLYEIEATGQPKAWILDDQDSQHCMLFIQEVRLVENMLQLERIEPLALDYEQDSMAQKLLKKLVKEKDLHLIVKFGALELKNTDMIGKSDPYLEVWTLKPQLLRKTEWLRNNLNPSWKLFSIAQRAFAPDWQFQNLVFKVFDRDLIGKNDLIGQAECSSKTILSAAMQKKSLVWRLYEKSLTENSALGNPIQELTGRLRLEFAFANKDLTKIEQIKRLSNENSLYSYIDDNVSVDSTLSDLSSSSNPLKIGKADDFLTPLPSVQTRGVDGKNRSGSMQVPNFQRKPFQRLDRRGSAFKTVEDELTASTSTVDSMDSDLDPPCEPEREGTVVGAGTPSPRHTVEMEPDNRKTSQSVLISADILKQLHKAQSMTESDLEEENEDDSGPAIRNSSFGDKSANKRPEISEDNSENVSIDSAQNRVRKVSVSPVASQENLLALPSDCQNDISGSEESLVGSVSDNSSISGPSKSMEDIAETDEAKPDIQNEYQDTDPRSNKLETAHEIPEQQNDPAVLVKGTDSHANESSNDSDLLVKEIEKEKNFGNESPIENNGMAKIDKKERNLDEMNQIAHLLNKMDANLPNLRREETQEIEENEISETSEVDIHSTPSYPEFLLNSCPDDKSQRPHGSDQMESVGETNNDNRSVDFSEMNNDSSQEEMTINKKGELDNSDNEFSTEIENKIENRVEQQDVSVSGSEVENNLAGLLDENLVPEKSKEVSPGSELHLSDPSLETSLEFSQSYCEVLAPENASQLEESVRFAEMKEKRMSLELSQDFHFGSPDLVNEELESVKFASIESLDDYKVNELAENNLNDSFVDAAGELQADQTELIPSEPVGNAEHKLNADKSCVSDDPKIDANAGEDITGKDVNQAAETKPTNFESDDKIENYDDRKDSSERDPTVEDDILITDFNQAAESKPKSFESDDKIENDDDRKDSSERDTTVEDDILVADFEQAAESKPTNFESNDKIENDDDRKDSSERDPTAEDDIPVADFEQAAESKPTNFESNDKTENDDDQKDSSERDPTVEDDILVADFEQAAESKPTNFESNDKIETDDDQKDSSERDPTVEEDILIADSEQAAESKPTNFESDDKTKNLDDKMGSPKTDSNLNEDIVDADSTEMAKSVFTHNESDYKTENDILNPNGNFGENNEDFVSNVKTESKPIAIVLDDKLKLAPSEEDVCLTEQFPSNVEVRKDLSGIQHLDLTVLEVTSETVDDEPEKVSAISHEDGVPNTLANKGIEVTAFETTICSPKQNDSFEVLSFTEMDEESESCAAVPNNSSNPDEVDGDSSIDPKLEQKSSVTSEEIDEDLQFSLDPTPNLQSGFKFDFKPLEIDDSKIRGGIDSDEFVSPVADNQVMEVDRLSLAEIDIEGDLKSPITSEVDDEVLKVTTLQDVQSVPENTIPSSPDNSTRINVSVNVEVLRSRPSSPEDPSPVIKSKTMNSTISTQVSSPKEGTFSRYVANISFDDDPYEDGINSEPKIEHKIIIESLPSSLIENSLKPELSSSSIQETPGRTSKRPTYWILLACIALGITSLALQRYRSS